MRNTQRTWPGRHLWLWPAAWAVFWIGFWLLSATLSVNYNMGNFGKISLEGGAIVLATPMDEQEALWRHGTGPEDAGTVTIDRTWPWFGKRWFGFDRHPAGAKGVLENGWEYPYPPYLYVYPRYSREMLTPFWAVLPVWMSALAAVPVLLRCVRERRRFKRGACPRCAYSRGGQFDGPCPECGAAVVLPVRRTGT